MIFGFGKNKKTDKVKAEREEKKKIESQEIVEPKFEASPDITKQSGWIKKLTGGLSKSSKQIGSGVKQIFTHRKLDDQALEALEELLIMSDLGVATSANIIEVLSKDKYNKEITETEVKQVLADEIAKILKPYANKLQIRQENKPHVILVSGVNGSGKTTTIGKLAHNFKVQGLKVMIAACDTYRAAAVEQLEVWANRSSVELIKGKLDSDPASVAYEAIAKAKADNIDVLIIDTAGRLQNKTNLMEQLAKINRVIKKIDESAPHDSIIVLDATTGQNANSQVKTFKEMVAISGMVITKLDGTAKGGVVVSLVKQFAMPVHAVGVGEGIEDLHEFDPEIFAKGLVGSN